MHKKIAICWFILVSFSSYLYAGSSSDPANINIIGSGPNVTSAKEYEISVETMKEVPAAIYHLFQKRGIFVLNVKVHNNSKYDRRFRIRYRSGFMNPDEYLEVEVPKNGEKTAYINPALSREDIRKVEILPTPNTMFVEVSLIDKSGITQSVFMERYDVMFLPYDQFISQITDLKGNKQDLLDTLANWVTVNDRGLSEVIEKASEKGLKLSPIVKIVGFQSPDAFAKKPTDNRTMEQSCKDCLSQVKLIYDVLKDDYKINYINQPIIYMNSQRIKYPYETLLKKGNCIELAVLFGSLLESVEIDPVLVIFLESKHAAIAFKVYGEGKEKYVMLETNVFGEDFDKVLKKGEILVAENNLQSEISDGIAFNKDGIYKKGEVVLFDIKKMRANIPPSPHIPTEREKYGKGK